MSKHKNNFVVGAFTDFESSQYEIFTDFIKAKEKYLEYKRAYKKAFFYQLVDCSENMEENVSLPTSKFFTQFVSVNAVKAGINNPKALKALVENTKDGE